MKTQKPRVVIIGGGAGGLELATKLGKNSCVRITLVDKSLTHLWKPLLHEVASGTLNSYEDELSYFSHAQKHGFEFAYGSLLSIERDKQLVWLDAIYNEQGEKIAEKRSLHYDYLVIAIGSVSNDFNTKGVKENCYYLDNEIEANVFHHELLSKWFATSYALEEKRKQLNIVIIGAGATGVELSAELRFTIGQLNKYGEKAKQLPENVQIHIIEAAPRILAQLPEDLSNKVKRQLESMQITLHPNERVLEVTKQAVKTQSGLSIPANIKVWAAGVKGPEVLKNLDLELNQRNQIKVKPNLQTTVDERIFALGDCAECILKGAKSPVPARAQAAHQQASFIVKAIPKLMKGKPMGEYKYVDYGSLISLSHSAVGELMGKFVGNFSIQGKFARMIYISLYRSHLIALHGIWRASMLTLANILSRQVKSRLKLH